MYEFLERFDLAVEAFNFITTALIAFGSLYAFSKTHKPRHAAFGIGFLIIALGLFLSVVFNWFIEIESMVIPLRGYIQMSYVLAGILLLSMLCVLAGYLILFIVAQEITSLKTIALVLLLAPLGVWVAHEFYTGYHVLSFIVTLFIFHHYVRVHIDDRGRHSLPIASAFGILMISQATLALTAFSSLFYVAGHLFRLISFAVLFVTLVSIYRTTSYAPKTSARKRA